MSRYIDLTGEKFGRLTVISKGDKANNGSIKWLCRCECGKEKYIRGDILRCGNTKSCGCLSSETAKSHLLNQRFGSLTVIKEIGRSKHGDVMWLCLCDCGNTTEVKSVNLIHGATKSCGCKTNEMISDKNKKHGLVNDKLYSVWSGMKSRCYNPNNREYNNYGGRGITICDEWKNDFTKFYNWAINNGFDKNLTIDRININQNYCPDNCRWITNKEQQRNKRNTIYLTYKNETKPLMEWSEIVGINSETIKNRLKRNWSVEDALEKPPIKYKQAEVEIK